MAGSDYVHGSMDIEEQKRTWDGFITGSVWGSFIIILAVAYATLALATGLHWMVALGICVALGIGGGLLLGMGGAWIATVIGLTALAVIVQLLIAIFSAIT